MQSELTLANAEVGDIVVVQRLNAHGSMRRRLLDIGLTEGAYVECIGRSPSGDPSAYLIRGAVIAIREDDSRDIIVKKTDQKGDQHGTYR